MKRKIIFVCTGNSARSQMAEGLLRYLGETTYDVYSAGTHPSIVHPLAIQVMKEIEIDISSHTSKSVTDFVHTYFDAVITVCDHAKENCPVFTNAQRKLHWSIEDPIGNTQTEEEKLYNFRKRRDELREKIREFLQEKK